MQPIDSSKGVPSGISRSAERHRLIHPSRAILEFIDLTPRITVSSACPVFAFPVRFVPRDEGDDDACRTLEREWQRFVEGRGLQSRGRAGSRFHFLVIGEGTQASDADRLAVERWLRQRGDLAHWTVGELRDLHEE